MLDIPADIWAQYAAVLAQRSVPSSRQGYYRKWLQYYLDFCATRNLPDSRQERTRLFLAKLQEKKQTPQQQQQAAQAVALYFALSRAQKKVPEIISDGGLPYQRERMPQTAPLPARGGASADSLRGKVAPVIPTEWEKIARRLAAEIKTRQYSGKP